MRTEFLWNLVWVLTQIYICAGHRIWIWIWCQTIRFSCSRRLQFKWHAWWRYQGCHSHLLSWKGPTSKTDCRHADDTWIDCATWTGKECRSIHVCEVAAESASFMCKGLDEFLDYGPLEVLTLSLWGTSSSESAVFRCHCTAGCSSLQKCVVETERRNNRAFVSKSVHMAH